MHVKRLYRPTVREALAAARQELGAGALVLSTELVPSPGWRGWLGQRTVRLTAANERPEELIEPQKDLEMVSASRSEVTADRHIVSGPKAGVVARLCASGLAEPFAEAVAARLTPAECRVASENTIRRAIEAELATGCAGDAGFARYEIFVGPPGVGKTTTIAKIASQERASGERAVALVSADGFRPGAIEQLRCYASVLGAPFRTARSASELDAALTAARHTALIDTAGRSPNDSSLTEMFGVIEQRKNVRTHLVLAADTTASAARRLLGRYAELKPVRAIITKLDEAETVLPLLNVLREQGLPVSYLTNGQRVPEDLQRATPASLAAALLNPPATGAAACL